MENKYWHEFEPEEEEEEELDAMTLAKAKREQELLEEEREWTGKTSIITHWFLKPFKSN